MVPIDASRLNFKRHQFDHPTPIKSPLVSFEVMQSNNDKKIKVVQIIKDLNTLIKNKHITAISRNYYTSFIDEDYGFVLTSKKQTNIIIII